MNRNLALVFSILLILAFAVSPAMGQSTGFFTAHVTSIQTTSAATIFDFTTDATPSGCNGVVFYVPASGADEPTQIANASAALASLLSAQLSGRTVSIIANLPTGNNFPWCTLTTLFVNNQ